MIAFAALSLLATAVLAGGQWGLGWLYAGRLLTGVVSGTVFTIGTAWVKELSDGSDPGVGARRASVALTAGFGVGPLVAGLLAQWAPGPVMLPYLVHLLLTVLALALLPRAPETRTQARTREPGTRAPLLPNSARTTRFRSITMPLAPWVFGSVTVAFITLPAHGIGTVAGLQRAPRTATMPNPTPPAAPPPAAWRWSSLVAAATQSAQRVSAASSWSTCAGSAPFCGP